MRDVTLLGRLRPFVWPDRRVVVVALVATPLAAALSLVQPYLVKRVIDDVLTAGRGGKLGLMVLLLLAAAAAGYVVEAVYSLSLSWAGQRTVLRLREALYRHVLRLAPRWLERQPAGRLLTRMTSDLEAVEEAFTSGVMGILLDLVLLVGTLGAMLWLDVGLTVIVMALAPPLLIALRLLRKTLRRLYLEVREAMAAVNAFLSERLHGVEVVQLFGTARRESFHFEQHNRRFRDAMVASNWADAMIYALVDGASAVFVAALLWWGSGAAAQAGLPAVASGPVTAGLLVAFIQYLERFFRPLREMAGKIAVLQRAAAGLEKVFGLLDINESEPEGTEPLAEVEGRIQVRELRFRYSDEGPDVLNGIDLDVRPGEVVAVVGATGAGKTTLLRILGGVYRDYRGSVQVDGVELVRARRAELVRSVAAVRQDALLFPEDLRFNVALDNPSIGAARLREAAEGASLSSLVSRLGWEHPLREGGAGLSVGEGQCVTIARIMAHTPSVVLLDEATASVDSVTERRVQAALERLFSGRTVIVVAHRLSTVRRADRIVVLEGGCIVEQGTHAELLDRGGRYAELVRAGEAALVA